MCLPAGAALVAAVGYAVGVVAVLVVVARVHQMAGLGDVGETGQADR